MIKKFQHLATQMLDQASGARTPKIYYNPEGDFAQILAYLPQLRQKYRPTPWLSNPHAHLLYFDLIKKKQTQFEYDRIDHCQMPDGGVTAIAWYGLHLPKETPIIIVLHTITGSPKTMAELVRDLYVQTGWKIALCLRRGHAALPLTVPKVSLFGFTEDLRIQLNNIQEMFPDAPLYAVGSSAGTGLLVRYLGEEGNTTPLRAAFALCPGYNTEESFSRVHPFYSKFMTKKLFKAFFEPYAETWKQIDTLHEVLESKTLADFEKRYFSLAGFSDYQSYTQATNPIYVFENIKIPLLILNAEDDPICHIENLDPYKDIIQKMPKVAVVTTQKGSHCGFYEGWLQTSSWATRLMSDYLKNYHDRHTSSQNHKI